jgi:hypothetical protein
VPAAAPVAGPAAAPPPGDPAAEPPPAACCGCWALAVDAPLCCSDCRRLASGLGRLCCDARVSDAMRPPSSWECRRAVPPALPAPPPPLPGPSRLLAPGRRALNVSLRGLMADLKTSHSSGTRPSSCTEGSSGQGQEKEARSPCVPPGASRPRSASLLRVEAPRKPCNVDVRSNQGLRSEAWLLCCGGSRSRHRPLPFEQNNFDSTQVILPSTAACPDLRTAIVSEMCLSRAISCTCWCMHSSMGLACCPLAPRIADCKRQGQSCRAERKTC